MCAPGGSENRACDLYHQRAMVGVEDDGWKEFCREFASDCELGNTASLNFYLQIGFQEQNRIICFKKVL